ncbi:hypothetical protein [Leptotrichia massiliensis]|jgi:hypothetical protein|uniref:hypothetical protein n=1 Tax=Leptotrichia massiliensis TaxID=1852388 RepID=UPI0008D8DB6C|nr:hypothetical protein [Leptotrichia massiliensis]DAE99968.1 MAG TPA: hypothetical protein [Caudoviricetes sp.]
MINEKIFKIVKQSMLSDRNITTGIIKEQKITEKFIQIIVSEHGDTITIKRETKENLRTFWNVSVVSDYNFKEYIEKYSITFTEFRREMEEIIEKNDVEDKDVYDIVEEALKNISERKLVSNSKKE